MASTLKKLPYGQLLLLHAKICLELSCLSNGKEIPTKMQVAPQHKLITLLALLSLLTLLSSFSAQTLYTQ